MSNYEYKMIPVETSVEILKHRKLRIDEKTKQNTTFSAIYCISFDFQVLNKLFSRFTMRDSAVDMR